MATRINNGLGHWMDEVLRLRAAALGAPEEDTIHDLRVALRRCRSMVQTLREIDGAPGWKKLGAEARSLFRALGALRDAQVQQGWVSELVGVDDPFGARLLQDLYAQERRQRKHASRALKDFDAERWEKWAAKLPARAEELARDEACFARLALLRLDAVERLDASSAREESPAGYHELRIAVKHLRYIAENFLPGPHRRGGAALKKVQDLLGETQDLSVLRAQVLRLAGKHDTDDEARVLGRIEAEQTRRIKDYRRRTRGARGVWKRWRLLLESMA